MSISYPLSLPSTLHPARVEWKQKVAVTFSRSQFTFRGQVQEHAGDGWGVVVDYPMLDREEMAALSATLSALRGPYGTFWFGDSLLHVPRGVGTGTPRVFSDSVAGVKQISIDGWTPSTTGILLAGDMFQIDYSMYQVLSDANSDGSGLASIDIFPSSRGHSADAVVTVQEPKLLMRLIDPEFAPYSADELQLYSLGFTAEEAL